MSEKEEKVDPDAPYLSSMTVQEMWDIFKVAAAKDYDWDTYSAKEVLISMHQMQPHVVNGYRSDIYALLFVPFKKSDGTYEKHIGFEAKFYEDGFFSYENGMDVMMRYSNPMEVHRMIERALNKTPRS